MIKINKSTKGFTLLELLVVIGIIGILVSIGTISYTSAQQRARDSRRRSDVAAIGKALEQYYSQNSSTYPTDTNCTGYASYLTGASPIDPKTGVAYIADGDCAATGDEFCVCALMEVTGTGNAYTKGGVTSQCNWDTGASKDYYCAQNQQ